MTPQELPEKWRKRAALLRKEDDAVCKGMAVTNEHNADQLEAALAGAGAVAYCCPHDPDSATAFAWPGTKRSATTHTMPLFTHPAPTPSVDTAALLALAEKLNQIGEGCRSRTAEMAYQHCANELRALAKGSKP